MIYAFSERAGRWLGVCAIAFSAPVVLAQLEFLDQSVETPTKEEAGDVTGTAIQFETAIEYIDELVRLDAELQIATKRRQIAEQVRAERIAKGEITEAPAQQEFEGGGDAPVAPTETAFDGLNINYIGAGRDGRFEVVLTKESDEGDAEVRTLTVGARAFGVVVEEIVPDGITVRDRSGRRARLSY